jgi:3-methyladenine DNA glycosylase/8-oxoguanine DNA glycosylase
MAEESTILVAMSRPNTLASLDLPAIVLALSERDPVLGRAIATLGPFDLAPGYSTPPYRRLLSAIVYQQLSGKAAATILSRVLGLFGGGRFPEPRHSPSGIWPRGPLMERSRLWPRRGGSMTRS